MEKKILLPPSFFVNKPTASNNFPNISSLLPTVEICQPEDRKEGFSEATNDYIQNKCLTSHNDAFQRKFMEIFSNSEHIKSSGDCFLNETNSISQNMERKTFTEKNDGSIGHAENDNKKIIDKIFGRKTNAETLTSSISCKNDEVNKNELEFLIDTAVSKIYEKQLSEFKNEIEELKSSLSNQKDRERHIKKIHEEEIEKLRVDQIQKLKDLESADEEIKSLKKDFVETNKQKEILEIKVSDYQKDFENHKIWKDEKNEMDLKIKELEKKAVEKEKVFQMLETRFECTSDILKIQEQSLMENANEDQTKALLSKWRQKVFEVMIQSKSQQISSHEMKYKNKQELDEITNRLNEQKNINEILKNRITDEQAKYQLKEVELEAAYQQTEQNKNDQKEINNLYSYVNEVKKKADQMFEDYNSKLAQISLLEQRLAFAINQFSTVQNVIKQKYANWRMKVTQQNSTNENKEIEMLEERTFLEDQIHQLKTEQVLLQNEIEEKSLKIDELLDNKTSLTNQIKTLEATLENCQKKSQMMKDSLQDVQIENFSLKEEQSLLKNTFEDLKKTSKKNMELLEEKLQTEFENQLESKNIEIEMIKKSNLKLSQEIRNFQRLTVRKEDNLIEKFEKDYEQLNNEKIRLLDKVIKLEKEKTMMMASQQQLECEQFQERSKLKEQKMTESFSPDINQLLQDVSDLSTKVFDDTEMIKKSL